MASVTLNSKTVAVTDLTCSNVKPAVTAALGWGPGWTATACTSDPVSANTIITFTSGTNVWQGAITAVVENPSSSTTGSTGCSPSEFDYAYAAGVWGLAFTTVVGLYFASHGIGLALGMIRRG